MWKFILGFLAYPTLKFLAQVAFSIWHGKNERGPEYWQ